MTTTQWVTFTRRTDDPKLAWLERQLAARGCGVTQPWARY